MRVSRIGCCFISQIRRAALRFGEKRNRLRVHLINPSDTAFGTAVITPRWLFVLAAATPDEFGDPVLRDETLEALNVDTIQAGDIVGIGIHTGNALRGYAVGRLAKQRGAFVIFGGIHSTLFPEEAFERGSADCVAKTSCGAISTPGAIAWSLHPGCAMRRSGGRCRRRWKWSLPNGNRLASDG